MVTTAQLLAPFCPFVADELHRNLTGDADGSVHLTDWPAVDEAALDPALETSMALARRLVVLGRAARTDAKMKVRQPLRRALVLMAPGEVLAAEVAEQVAQELNVKELEVVRSLEGLIRYSVVPNFRALGPRLGGRLPAVKATLAGAAGAEVRARFEAEGVYALEVDGERVELGPEDVEIRAEEHEEFALAQEGPYAVALDLALDEDLRLEGLARELVRALNDHRKALGLEIADRVRVEVRASGPVAEAARRHGEWIAGEVLAVEWKTGEGGDPGRAGEGFALVSVEGTGVAVRVERAC